MFRFIRGIRTTHWAHGSRRVSQFKYLWSIVTRDDNVKHRLQYKWLIIDVGWIKTFFELEDPLRKLKTNVVRDVIATNCFLRSVGTPEVSTKLGYPYLRGKFWKNIHGATGSTMVKPTNKENRMVTNSKTPFQKFDV